MTQHLSDAATDTVTESLAEAIGGGPATWLWLFLLTLAVVAIARVFRERARRREKLAALERQLDTLYGPLEAWRLEARPLREAGAGLLPDARRAWLEETWLPKVASIATLLIERTSQLESPDDAAPLHTYLGELRAHLTGAADEPSWPSALEATWNERLESLRARAARLREGRPESEPTVGSNDLKPE
ncbi:MAG: hypothetical protein H6721_16590 [Sandaracinus sp.]|nr:hypothetical protein [Sandaracinus sp.]MCB9623253.1 hypothetical protein [Sandaracinus sp.]MCB9633737.1 hypothetical protein [Sandaracinus sp.]